MNPKLILSLALVMSGLVSGCATSKFKVVSEREWLIKNQRVVVEVTCLETTPEYYNTFSDQYFSVKAKLPRTRWNASFRVNTILQGNFSGTTLLITDAKNVANNPRFYFETGRSYTMGFDHIANGAVKKFAILSTNKPVSP